MPYFTVFGFTVFLEIPPQIASDRRVLSGFGYISTVLQIHTKIKKDVLSADTGCN